MSRLARSRLSIVRSCLPSQVGSYGSYAYDMTWARRRWARGRFEAFCASRTSAPLANASVAPGSTWTRGLLADTRHRNDLPEQAIDCFRPEAGPRGEGDLAPRPIKPGWVHRGGRSPCGEG